MSKNQKQAGIILVVIGVLIAAIVFVYLRFLFPASQAEVAIAPVPKTGTTIEPLPVPDRIPTQPEDLFTLEPPVPTIETIREPVFDFSDPGQLIYTGDDENLKNLHLVSRFTTHHPCCQDRVQNIQAMATIVDEAIIEPGAVFSLNEYVGERTEERGFVPAGTIMGGELVDTVGGGVSQFATTLYNAVYWGGYEDVYHQNHSWMFSRYPRAIEATISWPDPDLQFKNDTASPIVLNTRHTDTSITVEIWGNNDGRSVTGEHKGGNTAVDVIATGGPNARRVTSFVTPTFAAIIDIPTIVYPNINVEPGARIEVSSGTPGQIMNAFRTITIGETESIQTWRVVYKPIAREIHVHPCDLPFEQRVHSYDKYDYSDVVCPIEESNM